MKSLLFCILWIIDYSLSTTEVQNYMYILLATRATHMWIVFYNKSLVIDCNPQITPPSPFDCLSVSEME